MFAGGLVIGPSKFFPDPKLAMSDGLVAISDELSVDILVDAYSHGIFPWPHEDSPILWFSPDPRGVLFFDSYHISKSFGKFLKNCDWQIRWNQNFKSVIECCAQLKRKGESGTWITDHMIGNYLKLHQAGFAHSIEVYEGSELVGGLYGVWISGVFSGESMFFKRSSASKVALHALVNQLQKMNLQWLDIQMVTPYLKSVGGVYVDRNKFYEILLDSQSKAKSFKSLAPGSSSIRAIISERLREEV